MWEEEGVRDYSKVVINDWSLGPGQLESQMKVLAYPTGMAEFKDLGVIMIIK